MNKTTIEWSDFTWNPVTGCFHACRNVYCYNTIKPTATLNRFGARYIENGTIVSEKNWRTRETGENHIAFPGEIYPYGYDPTFYPHRLDEPKSVKKPSKIFVVNTGDLFGIWVPEEWIEKVLDIVKKCPQHIFQFLTKNPQRLLSVEFPQNAWVGTSINSNRDANRVEILKRVNAPVRYLSIEPLLGEITFDFKGIDWILIGAMTGTSSALFEPFASPFTIHIGAMTFHNIGSPRKAWIEGVLASADESKIPVFVKDNLVKYYPEGASLQEFPLKVQK